MGSIGKYLFSIVACALLISICKTVLPQKSVVGSLVKMICGVLLSITIISPLRRISFNDMYSIYSRIKIDGEMVAEDGSQMSKIQLEDSIKECVASYIFDKATSLELSVDTEVFLSNETVPRPNEIHITGNASPYAKAQLTQIIIRDLSIPEENILWN